MATKKDKPAENEKPANPATEVPNDYKIEKTPAQKDSDTAPDEFIGRYADTDIPEDGQIRNDAMLRGEDHVDEEDTQ